MKNSRHNFTEAMDRAKLNSQVKRNRGQHVGASAKGWKRVHAPAPEKGSADRLIATVRAAWSCASGLAMEDYLRAVYPERYEGFEL